MTIDRAFELATDPLFREVSNFITPPKAGVITAIEGSGQVRVDTDDPDGGDVLAWPLNGFTYAVDDVIYVAFAVNSPDSAIVLGSKGPTTPSLSTYIRRSGVDTLTGEWDIGEDMAIRAERFEARDNEGLRLEDDGGNVALAILDGGNAVVLGNSALLEPYSGYNAQNNVALAIRYATAHSSSTPIVSLVLENNQTGTSDGLVSSIIAVNEASGNSDKRIVQITMRTDGAVDDGQLRFGVFDGGVLNDALTIRKSGVVNIGLTSTNANMLGIKAGTSTNDAAVGGVLYVSTTTVGNVGTGERSVDGLLDPCQYAGGEQSKYLVRGGGAPGQHRRG